MVFGSSEDNNSTEIKIPTVDHHETHHHQLKNVCPEVIHYAPTSHGKTAFVLSTRNYLEGIEDLESTCSPVVENILVCLGGISLHSAHTYSYYHLAKRILEMDKDYVEECLREEQNPTTEHTSRGFHDDNLAILRYEAYGRGKSSNPNHDQNRELFVGQLKELLDYVLARPFVKKNCKVTVLGFSMGGCLATQFTHAHPEMVHDLILFSPAGGVWKLPTGAGLIKLPLLGSILYNAVDSSQTYEQKMEVDLFDMKNDVTQQRLKFALEMKEQEDHDVLVKSFLNSYKHFPLNDSKSEIENVASMNKHTLIFWAMFDTTVPSDECFPQFHTPFSKNDKASFILLNNTRHLFFMEREEDTARIVHNFIRRDCEVYRPLLHQVTSQELKKEICTADDLKKYEFFHSNEDYKQYIV